MLVAKHGFNIVAVEADWPDPGQKERVRADLAEPLLERAIGVIYRPETALFLGRAVAAIRCLDLAHRDERRRRARDHRLCRRTRRKLSFRPLSSPPYSFHIIAVL
jgi:hypothetical protein